MYNKSPKSKLDEIAEPIALSLSAYFPCFFKWGPISSRSRPSPPLYFCYTAKLKNTLTHSSRYKLVLTTGRGIRVLGVSLKESNSIFHLHEFERTLIIIVVEGVGALINIKM